jgi:hypothetical protein
MRPGLRQSESLRFCPIRYDARLVLEFGVGMREANLGRKQSSSNISVVFDSPKQNATLRYAMLSLQSGTSTKEQG